MENIIREASKRNVVEYSQMNLDQDRIKVLEGEYMIREYNLLDHYDRMLCNSVIYVDKCEETKNKIIYIIINRNNNSLVCKLEYDNSIHSEVEEIMLKQLENDENKPITNHWINDSNNCLSFGYKCDGFENYKIANIFYDIGDFFENKDKVNNLYFWDRKTNKIYKK